MVRVAPRYVIVEPVREPEPIDERGAAGVDVSLLEDLERLAEEDDPKTAVIARALLHIIERLDRNRLYVLSILWRS